MKFNFKKITSVLASAAMLGSTMGIAAAATYPQPLVVSGTADGAVVVGASAAPTDLWAAVDLGTKLQSFASTSSTDATDAVVTGGDSVAIQRSTDRFNLGDTMDTFYASLDSDELSTVLSTGTYLNDQNDEFEFEQEIVLGSVQLTHFQDSDFNDDIPVIGFNVARDTTLLTYTLDFTPDAAEGGTNYADLEQTDITLLGREYYIVDATTTSNGVKLTLLDTANSVFVTEGETKTVSAGDSSYDVSIKFIDNSDVIFEINGVTTNKLAEGSTYNLGNDVFVSVKNILYSSKDTGISQAELSIGSGKIEIENGQEVQVNNEDLSDISDYKITGTITNSSGDIDQISLVWATDDDVFLAPDSDLVLPGFESIKLSMAGFVTDDEEVTKIEPDGSDRFDISTKVTDGSVEFNLLYANATTLLGTGRDANRRLITSAANSIVFDEDDDDWFVVYWKNGDDSESYVLEVTSIDDSDPTKNVTKIESVASGSSKGVTLDIGEADDIGRIRLTLNAANEISGVVNISVTDAGSSGGEVGFDKIITKDGMTMTLPVAASVLGQTSYVMNITEEDKDGNVDDPDTSFTVTLAVVSGETSVSGTSLSTYETDDNSDDFVGYNPTDLATKVLHKTGGDQDTIELTYHGSEAYAEVFILENDAVLTPGAGGGGGGAGGTIPVVKDNEINSVKDKNLVVVGGSCVNTVARKIVSADATAPVCGADWTAATNVGAGQYIIKSVESPYNANKVAILVAGYEAADTTNAVNKFVEGTVSTDVGTSEVFPKSSA